MRSVSDSARASCSYSRVQAAPHARRGMCSAARTRDRQSRRSRDRVCAASEQPPAQPAAEEAARVPDNVQEAAQMAPRDDDVLPDSLLDSLRQAAEATNDAIAQNLSRCSAEILLPEFWDPISGPVFSEEGDQMRFWKLCRRFADDLMALRGAKCACVVFPDIGVAAYLKRTWTDAEFRLASLNDRKPVVGDEDLVIVAAADPQGAGDCVKLAEMVPPATPLVLFNARLVSGDVGIGLNVRRMRKQFLAQFVTTYSIRPIDDIGTIFRRWPAQWRVFVQDETKPGRYKLLAERSERPAGDVLDGILMNAAGDGEDGEGQGVLQNLAGTIASAQRFMRSLSN